jgi:hypothetical protein
MGERTRINARRSVTLLPLQAYALGWSMRLLGRHSGEITCLIRRHDELPKLTQVLAEEI